ncbi:MAG: hypothetical protein ACFFG0_01265 [Candidatus Thorarchaeota archaeon]
MKVLHITPERNLNSIFKNGIFRNKPILDQYNEVMEYIYGKEYNKEKGLIFCFPEEINRRDKYIVDFGYWKSWGDIRNRYLLKFDYEQYKKVEEIGPLIFKNLKPVLDKLKILLLDIKKEEWFCYHKHLQTSSMGNLWTDMDTRYEHSEKPLILLNYDVKPDKIKVIGTVESFLENNGKKWELD